MRILIVKRSGLGSVVRLAYVLPALAAKYPGARISWLTKEPADQLLVENPFIASIASIRQGLVALRSERFDLALSMSENTPMLEALASLKVTKVLGMQINNGVRTYCARSAPWFDMGTYSRFGKSRADYQKRTNQRPYHSFIEEIVEATIEHPSFFLSRAAVELANPYNSAFFNIGIATGSAPTWPSKQLPVPECINLCRALLGRRVQGRAVCLHLLGGVDEHQRHEAIRLSVSSDRVVYERSGLSLQTFAARIGTLDYVIAADSLPLHLAISQGVKNLSYYSATSAAEIGTFGTGVKITSTAPDYCSYHPRADNRTITAARIVTAFDQHLSNSIEALDVAAAPRAA